MFNNKNKIIILVGVILLASILRTPITGVGAILGMLKEILTINNTVAGFITTIPLIAFAIFSPLITKLSNKIGLEKTLFLSTIIITLGLIGRFYINTYAIFFTTFIIGVGIAGGNVLLPGLAKKYYPEKLGVMTGFYAVIMTISASIAAGISFPIANANIGSKNLSIGLALNIWVVLAVLSSIVYYIIYSKSSRSDKKEQQEESNTNYAKSIKMWTITLSMGLQSALFYCSVSWFAEIMISKGFSPQTAGVLLSISQFAQFPATFFVPVIADKIKNKLVIPVVISLFYIIALFGMLNTGANFALMTLWIVLYALAGGGSFSYVMYLFSAKSKTDKEAATISGLAQSGGYLLAAIFPPLLGYIRDISSWNSAIYLLLVTAAILLVCLVHCSSDGNIIED